MEVGLALGVGVRGRVRVGARVGVRAGVRVRVRAGARVRVMALWETLMARPASSKPSIWSMHFLPSVAWLGVRVRARARVRARLRLRLSLTAGARVRVVACLKWTKP